MVFPLFHEFYRHNSLGRCPTQAMAQQQNMCMTLQKSQVQSWDSRSWSFAKLMRLCAHWVWGLCVVNHILLD